MSNPVLVVQEKSVGISILLTILFGPIGMFYSTINGACIMLGVSILAAIFTLGLSIFITWPICVIWAAMEAQNYNEQLRRQLNQTK